MNELSNCPKCGDIFVKTQFMDVCQQCRKEEEKDYEVVYQYIRKRENRSATIKQVEEGTGVSEELILKFIKTGKLRLAQYPNLGYPCENCGVSIQKGKICDECAVHLRKDLATFNHEKDRRDEIERREKQGTYYASDIHSRSRSDK